MNYQSTNTHARTRSACQERPRRIRAAAHRQRRPQIAALVAHGTVFVVREEGNHRGDLLGVANRLKYRYSCLFCVVLFLYSIRVYTLTCIPLVSLFPLRAFRSVNCASWRAAAHKRPYVLSVDADQREREREMNRGRQGDEKRSETNFDNVVVVNVAFCCCV
jgi:hypothetical protein